MTDRIATIEARQEGFYWVILSQNRRRSPTRSAASGGWLAIREPWKPEAVTVATDRLVFKPMLVPCRMSTGAQVTLAGATEALCGVTT
jgi:hypothetical protein